jgi:heme/copper-type cytochrome/quinol oxidase subunit 4
MNCWKDTKTALMGQMFFFGYLIKTAAVPLQERLGHQVFLKRVLIPLNILSFFLQTLSHSYISRCIGFLLSGFCKIKLIPLSMILTGCVESKHRAHTITFLYSFIASTTTLMCFYINYVSKNAINYLHFTNGMSILALAVFFAISVESPLKQLRNGDVEAAKQNLNFIARVNSFGSRVIAYQFDDYIRLYATKVETVE